jgi:hypothetical protein
MQDNRFVSTDLTPTCADNAANKLIGSIVAGFKK